jgi:DNA-directed RNA polymerase subunit RPC12/RpoP
VSAGKLTLLGWSVDLQRIALWVVIASVAAAAFMGVFALLAGDFGETQGRVLGTTFLILGASLLVMATAPAVTRGWLTPLPEAGIGLAIGGFGLFSVIIWNDDPPEVLVKLSMVLIIWAVTIAHASLLSAAKLEDAYVWVLWIAYGSAAALALILTIVVLNDFEGGSAMGRLIGVVAITVASSSIGVPVFHRMSRLDEVDIDFGRRPPGEATFSFCPSCGAGVEARAPGEVIECAACHSRTVVQPASD